MGIDAFQVRITRAVAIHVIQGEFAQLICLGCCNAHRVTQLEIVHRLGAVRQVQRRPDAKEMLGEIIIGGIVGEGIGVFAFHQLADEADAWLHGETAKLVLQGDKCLVVQIGEVGLVGTVNVIHPFFSNY